MYSSVQLVQCTACTVYSGDNAYLGLILFFNFKCNVLFRSGRISSVYIVGWLLLLVGCHTFSKLVNFECVGMLECWCVGVL